MKRALLTIWMLAMALGSVVAHADQIFVFEGHTYKIVTKPASWEEASASAAKMQLAGLAGYLARINSERENRAVLEASRPAARLNTRRLASTRGQSNSDGWRVPPEREPAGGSGPLSSASP